MGQIYNFSYKLFTSPYYVQIASRVPPVAYFASICGHWLLSISPVGEVDPFTYSKNSYSGRIILLHNSYNWGIFSIWHSPMFTPRSMGYTSIVGRPKITSHFSYMALHSPTIKGSLPYYKNVRFNYCIDSLIALLSHCLAYSRLGLIRTPEEF